MFLLNNPGGDCAWEELVPNRKERKEKKSGSIKNGGLPMLNLVNEFVYNVEKMLEY